MEWTQATPHAQFSTRRGHSTVVFDDSIWVIGGGDPPYHYFSDIWRSDDGVTWTQVTSHAEFGERGGHGSVVFDDKIWVIGGRDGTTKKPLNDVWYSLDGITWTRAVSSAPFAPRWNFGITVFDGKMWVIGGSQDGPVYNDVWYSSDGRNWKKATGNAGFLPRMDLTATSFDEKIWVTGGFDWKQHFNDLWYSENGVIWTKVTDHAPYPARRYQKTEVIDGKMWLVGGIGGDDPYNWKYLTDVWYSSNGADWTRATADAGFPGRYEFTTAAFDNKIWVIAGNSGNSIWHSPEFESPSGTVKDLPAGILVTKTIMPVSLKQGTDAVITITVLNRGPAPVHDVEILDTTQQEFPVTGGTTQHSARLIEPDDTIILTYTVHAIKPGSFRLNRTAVMYADQDGNYQVTYSNYEKAEVLPSLLAPAPEDPSDYFIRDLIAWINGFDPFV